MIRRSTLSLCLLGLFALGASLRNRIRLPARRRQALSPSPVRRPLTPEEDARLALVRDAAVPVIAAGWPGMPIEEAARLAMAWPHNTPDVSARLQ